MQQDDFKDNVITNDREARPAEKSDNVWGVAFYATAPWPEKMCIQDYDAKPVDADGKSLIRFDVENGYAVYEVVGRCEYGAAYHGRLVESSYKSQGETMKFYCSKCWRRPCECKLRCETTN